MDVAGMNPLISAQKPSDSGLQVCIHPLVLLTISDYITRHTLRQQQGPIVGALLGQQHGREVTIEHAFECRTVTSTGGSETLLEASWFSARLDQMKLVHKDPELDLVGWYTLLGRSGPIPDVLPIHNQILSNYNESAILLAFHPEDVLDQSAGGRLPLTLYESNYEVDDTAGAARDAQQAGGEDKEMRDGGEAPAAALKLKFRELPYTVETGEAEMISMDYVAGGAGNAAAVAAGPQEEKSSTGAAVTKGKQKASAGTDASGKPEQGVLSREDDELISALTAKANAIKMLHARIQLITKYLEQLPPSYLSGEKGTQSASTTTTAAAGAHTTPSNTILRSIQALVGRLALLDLSADAAFEREMLSEANDVHLVSLLNDVMQSVDEVREIGKRFAVVEAARNHRLRNSGGAAGSAAGVELHLGGLAGPGDILA